MATGMRHGNRQETCSSLPTIEGEGWLNKTQPERAGTEDAGKMRCASHIFHGDPLPGVSKFCQRGDQCHMAIHMSIHMSERMSILMSMRMSIRIAMHMSMHMRI